MKVIGYEFGQSYPKTVLNSTELKPSILDLAGPEREKPASVMMETETHTKTQTQQPTILEHTTTSKMTLPYVSSNYQ